MIVIAGCRLCNQKGAGSDPQLRIADFKRVLMSLQRGFEAESAASVKIQSWKYWQRDRRTVRESIRYKAGGRAASCNAARIPNNATRSFCCFALLP